jgi:carbon storage regulator
VRGDSVRLGIEAPRDVPVHRKEIWDKIHLERRGIDYDPNHPDGEYA